MAKQSEAEQLLSDAGWRQAHGYDGKTPVAFVVRNGNLFAITAVDLAGVVRSGAREDPVSLALDLLAMGEQPAPEVPAPAPVETPAPEPVAAQEPVPEPTPEPEPAPAPPPPPNLIIDNEMLTQRVADLQAGLEDQRAEIERLRKENEDLRAAMPPPEFAEDAQDLPENLDEKLVDFGPVEDEPTTDQLIKEMQEATDPTHDAVAQMTRAKRKKFTELLNVELAELQQARGTAGENLKREANIEGLLGLFARVGEK